MSTRRLLMIGALAGISVALLLPARSVLGGAAGGPADRSDTVAASPTPGSAGPAAPAEKREIRVYQLQYADPSNLSPALRTLMGGRVSVAVDQRTRSLVVAASPDAFTQIEGLIKTLDREGRTGDGKVTTTITLRYADAYQTAELLRQSGSSVVAVREMNSLVYSGSQEGLRNVTAVLQQLDRPRKTVRLLCRVYHYPKEGSPQAALKDLLKSSGDKAGVEGLLEKSGYELAATFALQGKAGAEISTQQSVGGEGGGLLIRSARIQAVCRYDEDQSAKTVVLSPLRIELSFETRNAPTTSDTRPATVLNSGNYMSSSSVSLPIGQTILVVGSALRQGQSTGDKSRYLHLALTMEAMVSNE